MKLYLVTTSILFGLMAGVHVWRAIAEWPRPAVDAGFALGMAALIVIPALLCWWAWRLLRRLSEDPTERDSGRAQGSDPNNPA